MITMWILGIVAGVAAMVVTVFLNTPCAAAGVAVLVLGLVLTAYAAWRARALAVPSPP